MALVSSLETLNLSDNKLSDLESVQRSLVALKRLASLQLQGNPCAAETGYRMRLLENSTLAMLDNVAIKAYMKSQVSLSYSSASCLGHFNAVRRCVVLRRPCCRVVVSDGTVVGGGAQGRRHAADHRVAQQRVSGVPTNHPRALFSCVLRWVRCCVAGTERVSNSSAIARTKSWPPFASRRSQ